MIWKPLIYIIIDDLLNIATKSVQDARCVICFVRNGHLLNNSVNLQRVARYSKSDCRTTSTRRPAETVSCVIKDQCRGDESEIKVVLNKCIIQLFLHIFKKNHMIGIIRISFRCFKSFSCSVNLAEIDILLHQF